MSQKRYTFGGRTPRALEKMDALLDRLWELANEDDDRRSERVTEARALWRALEVLLASLKPQELSVGDGTFTKTLACIRSVLSDPSFWVVAIATDDGSDDSFMTVFVCVNRVLLKVSARGEQEREALVRDGVADLIVRCGESEQTAALTAFEAATALQTLQSLATDNKNRPSLQVSQTIRLCVTLMQKHATAFAVQLRGCQFLHQMALDEDCKERIGRHGGLQAVTGALARFAEEAELVVAAMDVLFFLCVELEYRDDAVPNVPFRSANTAVLQSVVGAVLGAMRVLQSVELVQANGVAVLNSLVVHPPVKQALCSLNIWEIAENGLSATAADDASCDFIELLETLLRDHVTRETLCQTLSRSSNPSQLNGDTVASIKALKTQVEALLHSQVGSVEIEARVTFVAARIQSLLDEGSIATTTRPQNVIAASANENRTDYNGYGEFMYSHLHPATTSHASTYTIDDSAEEFPVDSGESPAYMNDLQSEDEDGLIHDEGTRYFERFLRETSAKAGESSSGNDRSLNEPYALCKSPNGARICAKVHSTHAKELSHEKLEELVSFSRSASNKEAEERRTPAESNSIQAGSALDASDQETEKWQALYQASTREVERVRMMSRELEDRYCIVLRRAKEQTKLLTLQNVRLTGHASEHQQILRRMRLLEASLEEADRRCEVERALRSAEAVQCEQLSLALHESMREAKALAAQQSSTSRELQQKETMRTEYMMRTRESKHEKQRVEVERDNALLQVEILKHEKEELQQQLKDCRRENLETLSMREEDADARRPGVFSELAKAAALHQGGFHSHSQPSVMELSRRNSLPSETNVGHLSEPLNPPSPRTTLHRSTSVNPIQTRVDMALNDDPNSIGTAEIQSCLASVFQSFDTAMEGDREVGVHVSIVRRFFMEIGLVQAPHLLPADVDVVLAGVLAQSQVNRKNALVRKDFTSAGQTWAPPHGWAKTKKKASPTKAMIMAGDVTRYRFFNLDAFNEAVTLVGMRRFPRSDLLRVLQTVVALYLRPYMRQQQTQCHSLTNQRSRSPSHAVSRRNSTSIGSPSQVCSRAMKTILNGLALHLGHGNENELLRSRRSSGTNDGETRSHLYPPSSMNRSHKREDVVYSMLEMNSVLRREERPLSTICEFYSAQHGSNAVSAVSTSKVELFGLRFDLVLNFAIDFELIPSFMDRMSLKHLHTEVGGLLKAYFALHDKDPPNGADAETLKKVGFGMILARLALELFCSKPGYETPEAQITGLLQWLDNSSGREKLMRKAGIPLVIRFSRQLYSMKAK